MTSKSVWEWLRACWIDVYQGPLERTVYDAGKNFTSDKFKQNAGALAVEVKEVPVEAHYSLGKVERYHGPLRRAYEIIQTDCLSPSDITLQMAAKKLTTQPVQMALYLLSLSLALTPEFRATNQQLLPTSNNEQWQSRRSWKSWEKLWINAILPMHLVWGTAPAPFKPSNCSLVMR